MQLTGVTVATWSGLAVDCPGATLIVFHPVSSLAHVQSLPLPGVLTESATKEGNRWIKRMLQMPKQFVTGTVDDIAALADGTFSDEVNTLRHMLSALLR